jgi:hypothetical protein
MVIKKEKMGLLLFLPKRIKKIQMLRVKFVPVAQKRPKSASLNLEGPTRTPQSAQSAFNKAWFGFIAASLRHMVDGMQSLFQFVEVAV